MLGMDLLQTIVTINNHRNIANSFQYLYFTILWKKIFDSFDVATIRGDVICLFFRLWNMIKYINMSFIIECRIQGIHLKYREVGTHYVILFSICVNCEKCTKKTIIKLVVLLFFYNICIYCNLRNMIIKIDK